MSGHLREVTEDDEWPEVAWICSVTCAEKKM
jgi:hypothetical protein